MDKSDYLEQIRQQNSSDKAAEQATNNYWSESKALNEIFQLYEADKTIPLKLYIKWKESRSISWVELCDRLKMDLEAKRFLCDYYKSWSEKQPFDQNIWIETIGLCLFDPVYKPTDYTSHIFIYDHLIKRREIDSEIGPIKDLLIELEQIVGNECFNINKAEPWRRWGVLEPKCERLRYPLTFETQHDKAIKTHAVPINITNTDFISGKYVFGANQLDIFRGLYKVLKHLKSKGLLKDAIDI